MWRYVILVAACCLTAGQGSPLAAAELKAGCSIVDISPRVLPAFRNGGFLEQTSDKIDDPLHARTLVLSDGATTLSITIVDSCMVPRDVCDAVKARVQQDCGLSSDRMLIAATHTHSAPSLMDHCLGCRKDPAYADVFTPQVAKGIVQAHARLQPAQAGWTSTSAPHYTHSRRWLHRPDNYPLDPFGEKTVRAMMHPGYLNPNYLGPSGPVDSSLTLLSIRTAGGQPLSVLANYSMHYFGDRSSGFSADYFGDFARYLEEQVAGGSTDGPKFVAIMSQGTSGDLHWMDYSKPERKDYSRQRYARELGDNSLKALADVHYRRDVDLSMAETRLTIGRRIPSDDRIRWAKAVDAQRGDRRPKDLHEVYADQALWLRNHPSAELVLQAIRIGDLGMTAIPNEVFAITGSKLKAQSPLEPMMNLELANGAEGYIPPREQHYLGGYTTWPARTAGLATDAEEKVVSVMLDVLEQIARGAKRRPLRDNYYTAEQMQIIERARRDDNNRENRGANHTDAKPGM